MQKNQYVVNQYQKSKIFRMVAPGTDKVYFSGTYNKLATRKGVYRSQYKLFKEHGAGKNQAYYEIMERPDWKLELVEEYPCHSRAMLNARIQHWVNANPCLNRGENYVVLPDLVHPEDVAPLHKKKTIVHPKKEIEGVTIEEKPKPKQEIVEAGQFDSESDSDSDSQSESESESESEGEGETETQLDQ